MIHLEAVKAVLLLPLIPAAQSLVQLPSRAPGGSGGRTISSSSSSGPITVEVENPNGALSDAAAGQISFGLKSAVG